MISESLEHQLRDVIFLDFDGVMNCQTNDIFGTSREQLVFYPPNVAHLNLLCEQTGACLVISSGWRRDYEPKELMSRLRKACRAFGPRVCKSSEFPDFSLRFFTPRQPHLQQHTCWRTPDYEPDPSKLKGRYTRSQEIEAWLKVWGHDVRRWVAVDDEPGRYERHHIRDGHVCLTRDATGFDADTYHALLRHFSHA